MPEKIYSVRKVINRCEELIAMDRKFMTGEELVEAIFANDQATEQGVAAELLPVQEFGHALTPEEAFELYQNSKAAIG